MSSIQKILNFVSFTHKFQQIKRTIYVTGEDRNENDLEHSSQLALLAWYIADSKKINLNQEKLIKYALAHDLVETYAGDTYFHTTDQSIKDSKVKREKEALEKIKKEFQEFEEVVEMIDAYELRKDDESKFIYALDKVLPVLNIYLDGGRSWRRDKVTMEMARTKDEKVAISPEVEKVWKELVKILEADEQNLFPSSYK